MTDPVIRADLVGEKDRRVMADEIVRCPYCALGEDFRPMLSRPGGWFICESCLHMAKPEQPDFNCSCKKCRELNQAA